VFELDLAKVAAELGPRFDIGVDIVDEVLVPELPGAGDIDCGPEEHDKGSKGSDKDKGDSSAK